LKISEIPDSMDYIHVEGVIVRKSEPSNMETRFGPALYALQF
jgi:hypothetical protein